MDQPQPLPGWQAQKPSAEAVTVVLPRSCFPQAYYHFPYPWYDDPDFARYLDERPGLGFMMFVPRLCGSMGDDLQKRFVTPFDTGWENRIYWDHEFVGKKALQEMAKAPRRTVVTLE